MQTVNVMNKAILVTLKCLSVSSLSLVQMEDWSNYLFWLFSSHLHSDPFMGLEMFMFRSYLGLRVLPEARD